MSSRPSLLRRVALFAVIVFACGGRASAEESTLKLALILTRHGVRAPLDVQQEYAKFAAEPWPKWDVPAGYLTEHGRKQMEIMGAYYRERFIRDGLLSGKTADDAPHIFLRANNEERTLETAHTVGRALVPDADPEVHARAKGETDPLFRPVKIPVGHTDRTRAAAAALGHAGGDLHRVELAHREAFATLERVLLGEDAQVPAGKTALLDLPGKILPGTGENAVNLEGALRIAGSITDAFMLQYAEGRPMSEVGWGRLTPDRITELLELHSLWFEFQHGTFDAAQAEASNLVSHIGDTFEQAATGRANPGAFGSPGEKIVVISGHDTNQITVGALLGLNWWLPGTQRNPVLLGCALVFELRERASDHRFFVRVYQVSPTLDQTRSLERLTPEHPPAFAPIFVPACSEASPDFDAPLEKFEALVRRVVDPQMVTPSAL